MKDLTSQNEPRMFSSSSETVGVSWRKTLAVREKPARVLQALLQSVFKALLAQFSGRAVARLDGEAVTVRVILRLPEPSGSTKVCDAAVTLLIDEITEDGDARELVVVPRIRAEIHRLQDGLHWLARDADADVEQLTGEIQEVLLTVAP